MQKISSAQAMQRNEKIRSIIEIWRSYLKRAEESGDVLQARRCEDYIERWQSQLRTVEGR